ncbi:hypothetical protein [Streptomyces cyaneochromogenes]|nr:hypothetical protein [Streptomyces cyaneochromogenes]
MIRGPLGGGPLGARRLHDLETVRAYARALGTRVTVPRADRVRRP